MGTNTGLGIGIGIPFKNFSSGGRQPLPPDLKASLKGVWIAYGKSNNDADRSIVKNLVDPDNPFVISNAAYKLNSGYGKYEEDFTTWVGAAISINNGAGFKIEKNNTGWWGFSTYGVKATNEFKIKVTNCRDAFSWRYKDAEGIWQTMNITKDGIYTLPASQERDGHDAPRFFSGNPNATYNGLTVEQIPSYQGAFVTDGINDMITSTKTVQEMLGGSNEFTVVSMMANLDSVQMMCNSNYNNTNGYNPRNTLEPNGVISMLGYTDKNGTTNNLNLIMGDKDSIKLVDEVNFNSDYVFYPAQYYGSYYKAAWYWTVIANKVLTTDEINQVIAYFNLDRTLKPDILCNTIKQGITNENHAEFGDKLIDFSGNGRDIQLNNIAWKGGSGIAAKPFETIKDYTILSDEARQKLTIYNEFSYKVKSNTRNHYWVVQSIIKDNTSYQVTIITDKDCYWINSTSFTNNEGNKETIRKEYPVKANTPTQVTICGLNEFEYPEDIEPTIAVSFVNLSYAGEITVTFIPSYKGGILLDGINDFGQFVGDLGLKDYTFIADRAYDRILLEQAPFIASTQTNGQAPFLMEYLNEDTYVYPHSFGTTTKTTNLNIQRQISYQSTYVYNGNSISKRTSVDTGDGLTIGNSGSTGLQYSPLCLWSLMLFPYSMSEFLIERQLKKHKLGTLYPDMVEFRPVIKANANYKITYYQIDSTNTWKSIKVGDYIVIGAKLAFQITFDNDASELKEVVSPQLSGIIVEKRPSNPGYNIYSYITSKSPQKINITIDEYIRYEDIVQPYPVLLRFNDENGNEVSWGGKFKVGSNITRIGSIADPESNLLNGLYSISGLSLNGKAVTSSTSIVEKQMVFRTTATYLLDDNEPKCILSPRLLRIPNSSYKILGHIPDISGHGNHGKINNSAYKLNSGVNGYLVDFTTLKDDGIKGIVRTDSKIYLDKSFNYNQGFWLGRTNNPSPAYKVKVSGIPETGMLTYTGGVWLNLVNGINELPARTNTEEEHGFVIQSPNLDWSNLVIEQIGEYEGAYCLDGVDDFVTIPTIAGKQVLIKLNWQNKAIENLIYDQRDNGSTTTSFAIMPISINDTTNNKIAYRTRNANGITYIDGIRNEYIESYSLENIIHNITITNPDVSNKTVALGASNRNTADYFAKYALYDFMLFDNISTDDKIKELNEYVGIEAKVELPPYYWDTYGKTNSDADRDTIQQRGVAVGDYDLTNYNHAYEGMSGYNGYPVVFGANKTWKQMPTLNFTWNIDDNKLHITKVLIAGNGLLFSYVKLNGSLLNVKEIPSFKIKVSGLEGNSKFGYRYLATEDATEETLVYLGNGTHELAKSFASTEALLDLTRNAWVGIFITPMVEGEVVFDCDITIEVLPEYENGLVYDGITDYSKNANIPALDDFTAIIKREWLKKQGCPLIKGSKVYEGGNGNALLLEWDKAYNFVFYKRTDIMEGEVPDNISFITPTNYNGNVITRGSEQDTNGICIAGDGNAGFANMVFYKLILYPKTIPLLQINFLKNLMEKDEIIDLNNPIFIKNE